MSRHTDLIDEVNNATTEAERHIASAYLNGFREGLATAGLPFMPLCVEGDRHSEERFGDRPICCGVLLDWEPS